MCSSAFDLWLENHSFMEFFFYQFYPLITFWHLLQLFQMSKSWVYCLICEASLIWGNANTKESLFTESPLLFVVWENTIHLMIYYPW